MFSPKLTFCSITDRFAPFDISRFASSDSSTRPQAHTSSDMPTPQGPTSFDIPISSDRPTPQVPTSSYRLTHKESTSSDRPSPQSPTITLSSVFISPEDFQGYPKPGP